MFGVVKNNEMWPEIFESLDDAQIAVRDSVDPFDLQVDEIYVVELTVARRASLPPIEIIWV